MPLDHQPEPSDDDTNIRSRLPSERPPWPERDILELLIQELRHGEDLTDLRQVLRGESTLASWLVRRLRRRNGIEPEDWNAPRAGRLSRREYEVLDLLAQGLTNKEIASVLMIGPGTVKSHVTRILAKLGVADRTAAAVHAVRLGLVSREGQRWESGRTTPEP